MERAIKEAERIRNELAQVERVISNVETDWKISFIPLLTLLTIMFLKEKTGTRQSSRRWPLKLKMSGLL